MITENDIQYALQCQEGLKLKNDHEEIRWHRIWYWFRAVFPYDSIELVKNASDKAIANFKATI